MNTKVQPFSYVTCMAILKMILINDHWLWKPIAFSRALSRLLVCLSPPPPQNLKQNVPGIHVYKGLSDDSYEVLGDSVCSPNCNNVSLGHYLVFADNSVKRRDRNDCIFLLATRLPINSVRNDCTFSIDVERMILAVNGDYLSSRKCLNFWSKCCFSKRMLFKEREREKNYERFKKCMRNKLTA